MKKDKRKMDEILRDIGNDINDFNDYIDDVFKDFNKREKENKMSNYYRAINEDFGNNTESKGEKKKDKPYKVDKVFEEIIDKFEDEYATSYDDIKWEIDGISEHYEYGEALVFLTGEDSNGNIYEASGYQDGEGNIIEVYPESIEPHFNIKKETK